ncbi:MAG: hypothetical protein C0478_14900 [Planctomyces sp.]|nr:hypothetical protein [Planctomyces sp.]
MTKGTSKSGDNGTSRSSQPRQSVTQPFQTKSKTSKLSAVGKSGVEDSIPRLADESARVSSDWRTVTLAEIRHLIREADPDIVEERKWIKPTNPVGVPVWSHAGIVCTGETYKQAVKLAFAKGAALKDPHHLFNSSLDGNTRRAIDLREGEVLDEAAFTVLIRAAVAENLQSDALKSKGPSKGATKPKAGMKVDSDSKPAPPAKSKKTGEVVLLSGGNPQIAKGDGDAPVQAYIAAMPGWKSDLGRRLDTLIVRTVPDVRKAVKWNSPFYGIEGQGWFLSFHVLTRYVKVTFFSGMSLEPIPPGGTLKSKEARWLDIYEDDPLDEVQMSRWVKQAAEVPGWIP